MEMNFCLDTTFLIDCQIALRLGRELEANFLEEYPNAVFWVSSVAWGEFLAGKNESQTGFFENVRATLEIIETNEAVAEKYAEVYQQLSRKGALIGANDLWIAATALRVGYPLVTRNKSDFSKVPGLKIVTY